MIEFIQSVSKLHISSSYFDPHATLFDSRQYVRAEAEGDNYFVFTGGDVAYIKAAENGGYDVYCSDVELFERFFALDDDYAAMFARLEEFPFMAKALPFSRGVRLLRQEPEEVLFTAMLGGCRAKGDYTMIAKICDGLGESRDFCGKTYRTFPTAKAFANAGAEKLVEYGVKENRAKATALAAELLVREPTLLGEIAALSEEQATKVLRVFGGLGGKLIAQVLTSGFYKRRVFFTDKWMEEKYRQYFCDEPRRRAQISAYMVHLFTDDAAYANLCLNIYREHEPIAVSPLIEKGDANE